MSNKKQRPTRVKDANKKIRKKPSVLSTEKVEYVDYKDVNLLTRFVSDRSKIKARRVTGNDVQQQNEIARAIKNAREMALLPYTKRVSSQRTSRGDREGRNTEAAVDQVEAVETDLDVDVDVEGTDEAGEE
ncbi:MAG: ribosomal protein [Actinomycetota bacterium]|jgi:small subunit ribosomal protein S18